MLPVHLPGVGFAASMSPELILEQVGREKLRLLDETT